MFSYACLFDFALIFFSLCCKLQKLWKEFVVGAYHCCAEEFWQLFLSLRKASQVVKDKVLKVVKRIFPNAKGHKWPSTCRGLRRRVSVAHLRLRSGPCVYARS